MKYLPLYLLLLCFHQSFSQVTKPKYSLFNPAPKDKLRDFETDRPDVTESPSTVDAGHFQVESDLFKRTVSKTDQTTAIEHQFNVANLKLGLSRNTDLQLIVGSLINQYDLIDNKEKTNIKTGFGNLTVRVKHNIWGNDGGKTAFAIMPYVKIPTAKILENNYIETGVVFPFNVDINDRFSLGTQAQFDLLKSESNSYHAEILQSFVVGINLGEKLDSFVESYYTYNFEEQKMESFFNSGMSYKILNNLKIDAGFNLGLTKNSDNVYFIGFSFRY